MKLFNREQKQEQPAPHKPDNMLAMVALSEARLPDPVAFCDYLREHWPDMPSPAEVYIGGEGKDVPVLHFTLGGAVCFIGLLSVPIPWSELNGPCETAWYWPEAVTQMKAHRAHLIINVKHPGRTRVELALILTRIAAAAAEATQAVGIYWGAGTLVQSRASFVEQAHAASEDDLPLFLWIDFRVWANSDSTVTLVTEGMDAFGLMEMEFVEAKINARSLMDLAFNIAHYLLTSGAVIRDGDTVGMSTEQKLRVRYQSSIWERPGRVYRIELS